MNNILITDDESMVVKHLGERLERMGYGVAGFAYSGEEAICSAEKLCPDLILMDIKMPGRIDGVEAAAIIREKQDIPIIFITAYADDKLLDRVKHEQPYGYILKPYQERELKAVIEIAKHKIEMEEKLRTIEIKRKKRNRQLQFTQKMDSLGTLAGGIAHNFNNMLAIIMGCSQLATTECESKGCDNYEQCDIFNEIKIITDTAGRTRKITSKLLDLCKKKTINAKPESINCVVKNVVTLLDKPLQKKITIKMSLYDNLSPVCIDAGQIEQALLNISNNAMDSMPHGGALSFETNAIALDKNYCAIYDWLKPGSYCLVNVSDTGSGISKDIMEKVFDPFFTTKDVGKGTGLGLSITHGIIKSHGGNISIQSEPDKQTTVSIILPFTEEISRFKKEKQAGINEIYGTDTVLIVDDEKLLLKVAEKLLMRAGYNAITALGGKKAIEVYKENHKKIDIVILDIVMPDIDGYGVYKAIIAINPNVRVVFASGNLKNDIVNKLLDQGVQDYLQKPYVIEDLCKVIRKVLDA